MTGGMPFLYRFPRRATRTVVDNWRELALLDVVGKMSGRIVQNFLQKLDGKVLPES